MTVVFEVIKVVGLVVAALGGTAGLVAFFKLPALIKQIRAGTYRAGVDSASVLSAAAVKQATEFLVPYKDQNDFLSDQLAKTNIRLVEALEKIDKMREEIFSLRDEISQLRAVQSS